MIKANDLRCGNLVRVKEHFYEGAITYIDAENRIVKTDVSEFYNLLHFDDIEPIELTPELMGKIKGFSPSSIGYHIIVKNEDGVLIKLYIELTPTGNEFTYFKRFMCGDIEFRLDWEIKYLHQLQNVVYFFTGGMELEITL